MLVRAGKWKCVRMGLGCQCVATPSPVMLQPLSAPVLQLTGPWLFPLQEVSSLLLSTPTDKTTWLCQCPVPLEAGARRHRVL